MCSDSLKLEVPHRKNIEVLTVYLLIMEVNWLQKKLSTEFFKSFGFFTQYCYVCES